MKNRRSIIHIIVLFVLVMAGSAVPTQRVRSLPINPRAACGNISFALPAPSYTTSTGPNHAALGDFNSDGIQDLVTANSSGNNVSVLLGTAAGTFGTKTDFTMGSAPRSVAVGDFNGDGLQDLAAASSGSNRIFVRLRIAGGTGTGMFATPVGYTPGVGPYSVAINDFNGDGIVDLVAANRSELPASTSDVAFLRGIGDGTFAPRTVFAMTAGSIFIAAGDLNGDGKQDIVTADYDTNNVSIRLGDGAGSFGAVGAVTSLPVGTNPRSLSLSDLNGDGKLDLSVTNYGSGNVSILLGTGTGSFGAAMTFPAGNNPQSVAVGDFNGDGQKDLAVANYGSNTISILAGNGTGSFGTAIDFAVGTNPSAVIVRDFNSDGKQDLAVTNFGSNNVSILLNNCVSSVPTVAITLATYAVNEQTALNLHGTGITVADADGGSLTVTVAATDAGSQLTANVGTTGVVIVSGNGTPSLVLTGTIAQLNDLFAGNQGGTLTYRLEDDTPVATVTLTITANDGSLSGNDTAGINVTSINDAPVNTVPGAQATNEDTALIFSAGNGNQISTNDVDAGSNSLEVTLSVTNGSLTLAGTTGLSFTTGDGSVDSTMVFTGTLTNINNALAALTFNPTASYNGSAVLSLATSDVGNTGTGGTQTDTDAVNITIGALNDAPTVANPIPNQNATVNAAFNFQFAANTFSDPDVGDTLTYSAQLAGGGALPAWLSFTAATRTFSGTPAAGDVGTISIDVIANDGNGGTVTDTFNITVNAAAPTNPVITSVGTTNANGTYMVGGVISVTVTFDQSVNVDTSGGNPSILLETGTTDRAATYISGSGSNTLTFTYTVQVGDATSDLDYQSTSALALNGGTILSGSSQPAILTLPTLGGASSIAGQHNIVIDSITFGVSTTSLSSSYTTGPLTFTVSFNDDASDPAGNANIDDVTNPNNYLLVEDGANGVFNTQSCLGGVISDDTQITASSVTYVSKVATVNLSTTPPVGTYRLFVCGTTSIVDLAGNPIAGNGSTPGTDYIFNFVVGTSTTPTTTTTSVSTLPSTGFAPSRITSLPKQPADLAYTNMSDIWLEIPSLNIKTNVVGVPKADNNWDVTWLGRDAGWLNGTAFPSWEGNSVVTAHVTDSNGKPGPFANIKDMKYGDKIIVHMYGEKYIFEVQAARMVKPSSTQYAFKHLEDFAYLTLITCQGYDPSSESYLYRRIIRAVLVDVQSE